MNEKKDRGTSCRDTNGNPLPPDHRAKTFAARLPDRHPVKNLLNGASQRIAAHDRVYAFLTLFSETYAVRLERACGNAALRAMPPPFLSHELKAEEEAFRTLLVTDVIGAAGRCRLRRLHAEARSAIAQMTDGNPVLYDQFLCAFDRTFAALVRAVRLTPDPAPQKGLPALRLVHP